MRLTVLPLVAILAACSAGEDPAPEPTPSATVVAPRTLVAADFDPASLGPKIEGPQGTDPEFEVTSEGETIARVTSYVACPKAMTVCVPGEAPAGTVFTYVHTIVPVAAEPAPSSTETESDLPATATPGPAEVAPSLFRMTLPTSGFGGGVGYGRTEAQAALGAADPMTVTLDRGQLIWRVTGGSGWKPGAPVTVWWQTTAPPAGPQEAFLLDLAGVRVPVTAPFPAADKAVEGTPSR